MTISTDLCMTCGAYWRPCLCPIPAAISGFAEVLSAGSGTLTMEMIEQAAASIRRREDRAILGVPDPAADALNYLRGGLWPLQ